jgi:hypothetical protein
MIAGIGHHQTITSRNINNSLRIKEAGLDTCPIVSPETSFQSCQGGQHGGILDILHDPIIGAVGDVIVVIGVRSHAVGLEKSIGDYCVHDLRPSFVER